MKKNKELSLYLVGASREALLGCLVRAAKNEGLSQETTRGLLDYMTCELIDASKEDAEKAYWDFCEKVCADEGL